MLGLGDVDEHEAKVRARVAQMDIRLLQAIVDADDDLGDRAGHYDIRVDASKDGDRIPTLTRAPRVYRSARSSDDSSPLTKKQG